MEAGVALSCGFEIGNVKIGGGAPCAVIAEAGVSHFGDLEKAEQLVALAANAKATFFKTQHFKTDTMIGPESPEWRNRLRSRELPDEAIAHMKACCDERGIPFLCTPHDQIALDFLDHELKVDAFKVGSGEIENWPFIAEIARRGKPMIVSTGMYGIRQIKEMIDVVHENGAPPLAILHCVTAYPANPDSINLKAMATIRSFFDGPVGYSDHTEGSAVPLAAVALGAEIIEKHITIDKNIPNAQDWKVSCDPNDFPSFVKDIRTIESALGDGEKRMSDAEINSISWARKSITARIDLPSGTVIEENMVIGQRPGHGLPMSQLSEIIGKRLKVDVSAGTVIIKSMF